MNRMELYVVHCVNVLSVVVGVDSMTFECEILFYADWIHLVFSKTNKVGLAN